MFIEKQCPKCGEVKPHAEYFNNKRAHDGASCYCKPCWMAYVKARGRHDSPEAHERHKQRCLVYQKKNWVAVYEKEREWRSDNPEKVKATSRRGYKKNKGSRAAYHKRHNLQCKLEAFDAYGGRFCRCCGEDIPEMLTLDHINNDGNKTRESQKAGGRVYKWAKKAGWPPIFQVLCWNCNLGKHLSADKVCPHQQQSRSLTLVA